MTIAATMIQPNLRRSTDENRIVTRSNSGGRGKILTDQQQQAVVDLVRDRNHIRLTEIHQHILDNEDMFNNVGSISLPTIARILKRHQRVMELDADGDHHKFIYLDEAGFNLAKTRRRGRNFIGQRATNQVPGQRGANITMCESVSWCGRRPHIGPYNAALLVTFLDELDQVCRAEGVTYLIVWDNVMFHHAHVVQAWHSLPPCIYPHTLPP
ncbi:uncharacterized protein LOC123972033 [Micropterus dolomieu]|uniref:uncharacterized protein LOC123972033 n=1 Tax=Micropterus dolomieu TaxID=147949 RepID=UPI001E8E0A77|nr:uncharacterized protein LOC123972033 [Micropterus dolomieu]XP_045907200.1 uncharacterized protein LOC123972033 [Micropterus dolomieu]XP_045907201.1 uncharacterized protein LOC123972033 [Micropterus dolomieu]